MEESLILTIIIALSLALSLKLIFSKLNKPSPKLPPGPTPVLFFAKNVVLKKKSIFELEGIIIDLHKIYGPMVSLGTNIFIQDRDITHQALVQTGTAFADRPILKEPTLYLSCNGHDISSARYGSLWRLLRRNLTTEMLHPSRIRLFGSARRWALQILLYKLKTEADRDDGKVFVVKSFQLSIFSLLSIMCFGEKLDEAQIKEMQGIQNSLLLLFTRFNVFAVWPKIMKVVFSRKWDKIVGDRRRQAEIFVPLIKMRKDKKVNESENKFSYTYVDSLLDLKIAEEAGRELGDDEIVNLCHEFLTAGTDTTANPLEWIMAELVKHQEIQKKLTEEIERVVSIEEEIKEEDLQKMPYLNAVIMEGLRRHPPGHFLLPHRVAEDVILNGYLIPKGAEVNFNVMQIGLDEKVWDEPMEFKPERFMEREVVDITGSREIKMMPFGAGRRMCPGYGLAMLHLEYFVANLVREFEWNALEGEEIDFSEKCEFTTVMKNPLHARILPRWNRWKK